RLDYTAGEHDAPTRGVTAGAPGRDGREVRDDDAPLKAVLGQVAIHGARVGDEEVGVPQCLHPALDAPVGGGQRAGVANVGAAPEQQVGYAPGAMCATTLLAGPEVVNARGAR